MFILLNSREATDVCRETFPDLEVLALTVKYFAPKRKLAKQASKKAGGQ